ncbi:Serine/threonine-protein phosphatase 6 regulatory ankyrin repeat subunit B [Lachnellula occidentalis]|uniref:Serine/threonine-protein phosphatase 6 regulatory ankyrin repeat subunit B n=1 Tax=Lachnellula occidentalis TaxID=215460 RepID=A0A8H8UJH9_9HELO|nr:Serine/threonine-protein phosphatase 6 regulatory ankyrin repeat subunit B [Lachnellula occidentalis]
MAPPTTQQRSQRLQELANQLGAIPTTDTTLLTAPDHPPAFSGPDDDRKAKAILGQLDIEASHNPTLKKLYKADKYTVYSYAHLYDGLVQVVEEDGLPGVLEALLKRFKEEGGDISLARKGKTRKLHSDIPRERGYLLQKATTKRSVPFVQLLVPHGNQASLDESLRIALGFKDMAIIKLLLQYDANATLHNTAFIEAVKNNEVELVGLLLRARHTVSNECISGLLLPAAKSQYDKIVALLAQAGADGDHDNASTLICAVRTLQVNNVAAILLGRSPPSGPSLDRALALVLSAPQSIVNGNHLMIELLLCAGPVGDAVNDGLIQATKDINIDLMQLLLTYDIDINYKAGAAVGDAIQHNRTFLVEMLLQDHTISATAASELVHHIPRDASPMERIAILSKLLIHGACGTHCNELLIIAADQNDMETAHMLVTYGKQQNRSPICSVDYNAASCIKAALVRNNLPMIRFLAHEGRANSFSLSSAFAAIPPNLNEESHFLVVETLLRAGAKGPGVDDELHQVATKPQRSDRLVDILVRHGATVLEETLLDVVTQGSVETLKTLLSGNIAPATCTAAIPLAMKVHDPLNRYQIITLLLAPATAAGTDNVQVSQAVITLLQNTPEDNYLLRLLCQDGKANINAHEGLAVELATKLEGLEILEAVLKSHGGLPASPTVQRGLKCAIELPLTDRHRRDKVEILLQGVKPQQALDDALIQEIRSATMAASSVDLGVIKVLLDAGADVNAREGAAVWGSINHPSIMDLMLSKRPSMTSLTKASQQAMNLIEPARCILAEKLWTAGVSGEVNSKSMLHVLRKENETAIPILRLIVPRADVNYKEGQALRLVIKNMFIEGLDILLAAYPIIPSTATKSAAFMEAMNLQNQLKRLDIVSKLLKVGISTSIISDSLITAVITADFSLAELFLRHGASVEHNGGHAVIHAANSGHNSILKSLVSGEHCTKPSEFILTSAFVAAMALKEKGDRDCHYLVAEILLEAGVQGEPINVALVASVREGDVNLKLSQLLYDNGASAEWNGGEAVYIASQNPGCTETLSLLLQKQISENVLKDAYVIVAGLPNQQRYPVIERLLKAGKAIDRHVINSLVHAIQQSPPDRRLIKLLLSYNAYDEGQSIIYAAKSQDVETLELLVDSPKAAPFMSTAFNDTMSNDMQWQSIKGIGIMRLMLERGASGDPLAEALCKAAGRAYIDQQVLATEFLPILLQFGADVNYQQGRVLQWATKLFNVDLIKKLLPYASAHSKAMAIPYLFTSETDPIALLKCIQVFMDSMQDGDEHLYNTFEHPTQDLAHVLFLALEKFARKPQIFSALLDMGYNPNQSKMRELDPAIGMEEYPILCWALAQADNKISSISIENLIDQGANVNFQSKSGFTPLILAIQGQRPDIVCKLIVKGANVKTPNIDGVSPLAMASSSGNQKIMEYLLRANAEQNDGSLHDAARELRCDSIRLLIDYGHQPDYPSERHDGRSALAELCYKAVDYSPKSASLEEAVTCLIGRGADIWLKCVSQDRCAKTMLHYAMDSSNPMPILTILLKLMWTKVNDNSFLYLDANFTYSLTKYVEKDVFKGPPGHKEDILKLLRNKRIIDRFWGNDIEADQPEDYCGAPTYVEEEVVRQKLRRKRLTESKQDTIAALDLKRMAVQEEVKIMDLQTAAEIRWANEKDQAEQIRIQERATMQLKLEMQSASEHDRVTSFRQVAERDHMKQIGDVQVATARDMNGVLSEQLHIKHTLELEFTGAKVAKENEGTAARLAIENSAHLEDDMIAARKYEREKEMRGLLLQEDQTRNQMELGLIAQQLGIENEGVRARLMIEDGSKKVMDTYEANKHLRDLETKRVDGALIHKNMELVEKMKSENGMGRILESNSRSSSPSPSPQVYQPSIRVYPSSRMADASDISSIDQHNANLYP